MIQVLPIITLLTALLLSSIAGYYSVVGLALIFSGSFWPIVIMGGTLECAKLVTVSWLYRNWKNAPLLIKTYFSIAVSLLMIITSMGVFGYLSKAHIDQNTNTGETALKIEFIETQIASEKRKLENAQRSLSSLDKIVEQANSESASQIRIRQKRERDSLNSEIKLTLKNIEKFNDELIPLKKENLKMEAEIGPIRYIAELIYNKDDTQFIDKAVRLVIFVIIIVFDPLAILLLVASNMSQIRNKNTIEISGDNILFIEDKEIK